MAFILPSAVLHFFWNISRRLKFPSRKISSNIIYTRSFFGTLLPQFAFILLNDELNDG